jgi:tRNA threonylcarbamoyladenosine biosynthesis protein TsaE
MTLTSSSPGETEDIGFRIGRALAAGAVLALIGPLGAGKTCLVKGIARGLGITDTITSPSFTLVSEYSGPRDLTLYHIDLYRLVSEQELTDIGLEELVNGRAVCVIEWGEKAAAFLPPDAISLRIEIGPDLRRTLTFQGLTL